MKHLVAYMAATVGSGAGWMIGRPLGAGFGFFLSLVAAALAMYGVRRWWYHHLE